MAVVPGGSIWALETNSPAWVLTRTTSPSFMKSGSLTCKPVSSVAGLVDPPDPVSLRPPGSADDTASSTNGVD
jgi:hypothetical protein